MTTKRTGSGMGARVAAATPANAVAAGFAAATGAALPDATPDPEIETPAKIETVAINIRLPKPLHRELRQIAFDEESSINALLIEAAEKMLASRK